MPNFAATPPLLMDSPPLLLLLLILPSFLPGGASDLAGDTAALLALRASVGNSVLQWNATTSPYSWCGVYCSGHRVTALRLPAVGLLGAIPAGTIGNLTALRVLSLRLNALSGSLPPDISNLQNLRSLYLQGNQFSGELLDELFSLLSLSELDLSENNISGGISPHFNNLTRLRSLFLQNNQLSGELPNINLPDLIEFNVSYNKLKGSVPQGLRSMPATSFLGMPLCGGPMPPCASENPPPSSGARSGGKKSHKPPGGTIAGIAVGSAAEILILAGLLIVCCRRSKGGRRTRSAEAAAGPKQPEGSLSAAAGPKPPEESSPKEGNGAEMVEFYGAREERFSLDDLNNSSGQVLGIGTLGSTYRAVTEGRTVVVVKQLKDVEMEEWEFMERMQAISSIRHENVVRLQASYWSEQYKVVFYDYFPRGSLSALLHGPDRATLDWNKRCGIALAAARGIQCIHSTITRSSHGNIKSSNILLCDSNHALVSEHGLNQLSSSHLPANINGYRAPEVTDSRIVFQSADVYSFGVVLLELLTGKAPLEDDGVPDQLLRLLDPALMKDQNVQEESMLQVLHLAMDCTVLPSKRPSISDVVVRLEQIIASGSQHQPPGAIETQPLGGIERADYESSRRSESINDSRPPRNIFQ